MTKQFNHTDIENWAYFSGDYNTIHFDTETAKKNGLEDIIVQGMLYLLYSKFSLKDELTFPARINYRLKKPIYKGSAVEYYKLNKADEKSLKIRTLDDKCSVIGHVYHENNTGLTKKANTEIVINSKFILDQLYIFKKIYPEISVPWLIMDALLFSVCFKYQNGDPFHRKALKITKEPDKSKVVTYQVDQDIFISEHDFPSFPEDINELRFFYEDKDIIKEDYSVYSVLDYQVYYKDLLLYQSSMGSITRAFEAQSKAIDNGNGNAKE